MSEPFKNCPFCGGDKIKTVIDDGRGWELCQGCGATGPSFSKYSGEEGQDYVSWNTRATPTAPAEDEREAFERWARNKGWETFDRVTLDNGEDKYALPRLHELWRLWNEFSVSRASAPAAAADETVLPCELRVTLRDGGTEGVRFSKGVSMALVQKTIQRWYRAAAEASPTPEMSITDLEEMDVRTMTEDQIKHMAERFLRWPLPENFNPDGGISFEKFGNAGTPHQYERKPTGTNLFGYTEAKAMVLYMLEGLAAAPQPPAAGKLSEEENQLLCFAVFMLKHYDHERCGQDLDKLRQRLTSAEKEPGK